MEMWRGTFENKASFSGNSFVATTSLHPRSQWPIWLFNYTLFSAPAMVEQDSISCQ